MVGVTGPLVKGPSRNAMIGIESILALCGGCALGAIVAGLIFVPVASIQHTMSNQSALALFAAVGLLLMVVDLAWPGPLSVIGWSRQTCQAWTRSKHHNLANAAWGFDLGLGFTTFRVSSIYWLAVVAAVLLASAKAIPWLTLSYSAGLVAGIIAAVWANQHQKVRALVDRSISIRRILGIVIPIIIALIVVTH